MSLRSFRSDREQYISGRATKSDSVLHLGCTNSPHVKPSWFNGDLLHKRLCAKLPARIVGMDVDPAAIEWLAKMMPTERLVLGDAHNLDKLFPTERFDLIIASDIIEHLPNPGRFLEACRSVLTPDGTLLVTTVNAFTAVRFLKALVDHEAVHPDHTAYYSLSTLSRLARMSGYKLTAAGYYACDPKLMKKGINGIVSSFVEKAACLVWPQFSEGLIFELVPSETSVAATDFEATPDAIRVVPN